MDTLYKDIKVRFVVENFGKYYVQEVTKFYEDEWNINNIEVIIKECSKVYIEFEGSNSSSSLLVENVYQEGGAPFKLASGESKMLFELENNYSMLIPGSYVIKVSIGNKNIYSMFEIIPRHINDIQLKNLRDFINNEVSYLSYNMSSKLQDANYTDNIDYISIVKQYSEFYKDLKINLNSIMNDPYATLEKRYVVNGKHEKLDRKAIYLNSKGKKNHDYSYKKFKDFNNKPNITIKSIALKMLNSLLDIEEKITYAYNQNKLEEEAITREAEVKRISVEKVKDIGLNNREFENRMKSYDKAQTSLGMIQKRMEDFKHTIKILTGIKNILYSFVNSTYIKGIPTAYNINYKGVKLEDRRYKSILKIYNEIYLKKSKKTVSYKPSELLYEYFTFLVVIKIFKELDFTLCDCSFKNIAKDNFLDKIPKGCLAKFTKGKSEVRVWYEKEMLSIPEESMTMNNGFYTHAPNKLPDVRVDFLENNILKKSIIVESKYRRYSYLWNDYYNTHTMVQIKNYKTTVKYIWNYNEKPIYPIEKVIVLYPGEEGVKNVIDKEWGEYTFLQLRPNDSGEIYGYRELKKLIENIK